MITVDDLAGVIGARLELADPGGTIFPGQVWFGRGPDTPAGYPYVVFEVAAGPARMYSGSVYSQTWTVKGAAYCQQGATGSMQAVQQALNTALVSQAAQLAWADVTLRTANDLILSTRPLDSADSKYAPTLRAGQDVFVTALACEFLVQSDRSAA